MDANQIITDLQVATGWKQISLVNGTIVLKCTLDEMRCVKGLKQGNDSLYIEYPEFQDIPLSFLVTAPDTVHQYWVLGSRLHRTNDLPAYVSYNPTDDRIIRRWYWNGLKHRTTGPAQETTEGFKVEDLTGFPDFYQESWKYMNLEWYQGGFASRFPYCSEATLNEGQRTKNKKTNRVQSPRSDLPALFAESCAMTWDNFKPSDEFRPVTASMDEFSELHDSEGVITKRECLRCDFTWKRGDDVFNANEHTAFNEEFKRDLLSMVDLWGPFYQDDATEFLVISEFDRIRGKQ